MFVVTLLLSGLEAEGGVVARGEREHDINYISEPENVPHFQNFQAPDFNPGDSGPVNFTITNRYDMDILNVSLTLEIYLLWDSREFRDMDEVDSPPIFTTTQQNVTEIEWDSISRDETKVNPINSISTTEDTEGGMYKIRFNLSFEYNSSTFIIKSQGYFTEDKWEFASNNPEPERPGRVNLTHLGIDGLLSDAVIIVKETENDGFIPGFMGIELIGALTICLGIVYEGNRRSCRRSCCQCRDRQGERARLIR